MTKQVLSGKKKVVTLKNKAVYGYAFHASQDEILTFVVEDGQVHVPEYVDYISYIIEGSLEGEYISDIYAAIYTTAQKALGNETFDLLKKTGDVRFVEEFTNCFSKQDYSAFQKSIQEAINDSDKRGVKGIDFNCVPADDAYTVLDLLDELCSKGNKFHPYDVNFSYDRIGAKKVQKSSVMSEEDKAELQAAIDAGNVQGLTAKLSEIKEYKFTPYGNNPGFDTEVVFNSSRPNVNIRFVVPGTVHIGKNDLGLWEDFHTRITRAYTMVKDGIKHTSLLCLPFSLTESSYCKLVKEGVLEHTGYQVDKVYYIDARNLPVINRKMFKEVSAKEFFGTHVDRLLLQAEQKVYNTFMKADFYVSTGFVSAYSEAAEQFLASIGITEKNGFNPQTVRVAPTDKYIAKEVTVKIAKCSSIPTINDKLFEKIEAGKKLTLAESLVAPYVNVVKEFKNNKLLSQETDSYKIWLEGKKKHTVSCIREKTLSISKYVFVLTLSKSWFKEFSSMDENTMTITRNGNDFDCSVEVKDIEIEI
jgi:hypothetical protein